MKKKIKYHLLNVLTLFDYYLRKIYANKFGGSKNSPHLCRVFFTQ
jgi:hypothetical protein